jgi:hypothetical protein
MKLWKTGEIFQQPISDFCVFDHKVCDKNGNILHIRQCTGWDNKAQTHALTLSKSLSPTSVFFFLGGSFRNFNLLYSDSHHPISFLTFKESPFPRIKFPSRGWHHPQETSKDRVGLIRGAAAWGIYNFSGSIKHPQETERTTYSCHKSPQVLLGIEAPVDWTLLLEQTQTASSRYLYPTSHCCVPNNSASSWRFSIHFWN